MELSFSTVHKVRFITALRKVQVRTWAGLAATLANRPAGRYCRHWYVGDVCIMYGARVRWGRGFCWQANRQTEEVDGRRMNGRLGNEKHLPARTKGANRSKGGRSLPNFLQHNLEVPESGVGSGTSVWLRVPALDGVSGSLYGVWMTASKPGVSELEVGFARSLH